MRTVRTAGFTLIELLVVIAIIGILFGFTAVAVPRILERAKIAQTTNAANQLRTVLSTHYTDHGTYPPRYGYRTRTNDFYYRPFLHQLGVYSIEGYEDPFSTGMDTDGPFGQPNQNPVGPPTPIGLLEFFPIGQSVGPGQRQYPDGSLYRGMDGSPAAQDAERQLLEDQRTFVYLPVNTRQMDFVRAYYERHPDGINLDRAYARTFDLNDPRLEGFTRPDAFPPPRYDAFVLLSVGPGTETGGILVDPLGNEPANAIYHITAMRAYYLATRDLNDSGQKDFDFIARSRNNEARALENDLGTEFALLPNGTMRYGPMIFSY